MIIHGNLNTRPVRFACEPDANMRCKHCGRSVPFPPLECFVLMRRWIEAGRLPEEHEPTPGPGLGDYTEWLLRCVGVTEDRYKQAKAMFGLAPTCECHDRKQWLNRVGRWWSEQNSGK